MSRNLSPNRPSTPSGAPGARPLVGGEGHGQTHPPGAAISPEDLAEFQWIYRKDYGMDLTPEEARIKGQQLVELFRLLLQPPR